MIIRATAMRSQLCRLLIAPALCLATASVAADLDPVKSAIALKDYERLLSMLEKKDASGQASAAYRLSALYRLGLGVSQDYDVAQDYARSAHERGDRRGSFMLSFLCTHADCPEDPERLLTLAAPELLAAKQRMEAPAMPKLPLTPASLVWRITHQGDRGAVALPDSIQGSLLLDKDDLGRNALVRAVETGNANLVKTWLGDDEQTKAIPTATLWAALASDRPDILGALLEHGANPNAQDSRGSTPLVFAVSLGNSTAAQVLLKHGADPNSATQYGQTALAIALAREDKTTATLLKEAGAEYQGPSKRPLDTSTQQEQERFSQWSVLEIAAWQGQPERLKATLAGARNVFGSDSTREHSLLLAAQSGCSTCIDLLVNHGTAVSTRGTDGRQAIHWAAASTKGPALLQALLSAGADPNAKTKKGRTPLMEAAKSGTLESVQSLLAAGAEVNLTDEAGQSALLHASKNGHTALTTVLLHAGANPGIADRHHRDALILAVLGKRLQMLESLIANTKHKLLARYPWQRALVISVTDACRECLQILLPHAGREQVQRATATGNTLLILASERGDIDAVQSLLAYDADPTPRNGEGNSALMLAAKHGYRNIVIRLLEAGADPLKRNRMKHNAKELAETAGHEGIAELIDDYVSTNKSWLRVITG